MAAAEILLGHFDRIAGVHETSYRISPEHIESAIKSLIYRGFPETNALTGFTFGLSHFHPPGGAHKELMISMRSVDHAWALACGYLAFKLREQCPFNCGDTINFREEISPESRMNAFLVTHPAYLSPNDKIVDLGFRQVELVELVPIYEQERQWIEEGGAPNIFLQSRPRCDFLDPAREPFVLPK